MEPALLLLFLLVLLYLSGKNPVTDWINKIIRDFQAVGRSEPFCSKSRLSWRKVELKCRYFSDYNNCLYQEFLDYYRLLYRSCCIKRTARCQVMSDDRRHRELNPTELETLIELVKNTFHSFIHQIPPSEIRRFNRTQSLLEELISIEFGDRISPLPYDKSHLSDRWYYKGDSCPPKPPR